jgi:UDP-glucuronate decarboxylase
VKTNYKKILNSVDLQSLKNKRVLITGANGLIGGFLSEFFNYLNKTHDYNIKLVLTSLSKNPERIKGLLNSVKYISKDLSKDSSLIDNLLWKSMGQIDYCFYCAGYAQPSKFMSKPSETMAINTLGVDNIFKNIFNHNPNAKCVFLSSSEVYSANKTKDSHKETDAIFIDINNKRNFYILGKLGGESIVKNFRMNGFDAISARVSLCYGPGILQGDTRVMSEFVLKGLTEDCIQLFDEGDASRRYLHIEDFTVMLLNTTLFGKKGLYNICGEEENSIYSLACIVGEKLNKVVKKGKANNLVSTTAPKIVWNSLERYDAEFEKIKLKPLREGVLEFINWYINEFDY